MMFIFRAWDKEDALDVRTSNRDDHLLWLKSLGQKLMLAGPSLDENGKMNGSMLVLDYDDQAELEAVLAEDPYAKAGLFVKTQIAAYKAVIVNF